MPASLHPYQQSLFADFCMLALLAGVQWNLSVVLICISLIARKLEHFFTSISLFNFIFSKIVVHVPHSLLNSIVCFAVVAFLSL